MNAPGAVSIAFGRVAGLLAVLPPAGDWLSAEEDQRLRGIHSARRREQFLAARWQARQVLAQRAGGMPQDWRLSAPDAAPPVVLGQARWQLSISHSADWVACAVAQQPVGLDLEAPRRRRDVAGLVALCCTARERRLFASLDDAARDALFYELWTVKESWLKRRGEWIAPQRLVRIEATPAAQGEVRTWRGQGWFAALCGSGEAVCSGAGVEFARTWQVTDP